MTDTPRTDEWVRLFNSNATSALSAAAFARQLERDMTALRNALKLVLDDWANANHIGDDAREQAERALDGCGCLETYPRLVPGSFSHGTGCPAASTAAAQQELYIAVDAAVHALSEIAKMPGVPPGVAEFARVECAMVAKGLESPERSSLSETHPTVTEEMVNRFLNWPLPASVCADPCATRTDYPHQRVGTNLLTADEARQMLEHVLAGSTPNSATHDTVSVPRSLAERSEAMFRSVDPEGCIAQEWKSALADSTGLPTKE